MATYTLFPNIWRILGKNLFTPSASPDSKHSDRDNAEEIRRAERDCVRDMIWSNPEAFSSELDFQALACRFRGKF